MKQMIFGICLLMFSSLAHGKVEELLVDEIDYFDATQMEFSATTPYASLPSGSPVEVSVTTELTDAVFAPNGYLESGTIQLRVWQNTNPLDTSLANTDRQHCVRVDLLQAVTTALRKAKVTFYNSNGLSLEKPGVNAIGPSLETCTDYEPIDAD